MTQESFFRAFMFTWRWKCFMCLIFPFFNHQSVCISHRAEQSSNGILCMLALWESSMHKNPDYISVLYPSKSFWHLFTEVDCRKQEGVPASWYAIELPDPLNSPHMNVETLITEEQGGLIWRGFLFADSCCSLSNKVMTVNFHEFFLNII